MEFFWSQTPVERLLLQPTGDCGTYDWSATDPGFTDDFYDSMYTIYMGNLNTQDTGGDSYN